MATWNGAVAASADDATELNGNMTVAGVTLNANSTTQFIGLRFPSCPIPNGSTINSAVITVDVQNNTNDDPDLNIKCQLGNAAQFAATSNDITNRSKTTSSTQWTESSILSGTHNTPNFAATLEEAVSHGSWAANQALGVFFLPRQNSSALTIFAHDNGSRYVTIWVDYTEPASGDGAMSKTARTRLATKVGGLLTA